MLDISNGNDYTMAMAIQRTIGQDIIRDTDTGIDISCWR